MSYTFCISHGIYPSWYNIFIDSCESANLNQFQPVLQICSYLHSHVSLAPALLFNFK